MEANVAGTSSHLSQPAVKVAFIEAGHLRQLPRVCYCQTATLDRDRVIQPQLLQDPVEVDCRHAQRVSEQRLRQRHLEMSLAGKANIPRSKIEFAHEMSDAFGAGAPSHARDPGSHCALVYELADVHGLCYAWTPL